MNTDAQGGDNYPRSQLLMLRASLLIAITPSTHTPQQNKQGYLLFNTSITSLEGRNPQMVLGLETRLGGDHL